MKKQQDLFDCKKNNNRKLKGENLLYNSEKVIFYQLLVRQREIPHFISEPFLTSVQFTPKKKPRPPQC